MKKIIFTLVLFVTGFGFCQNKILITLQDGNFTVTDSEISSQFDITDSGLNQILNNYTASYDHEVVASCSSKIMITTTLPTSQNTSNFINDLNAYDAVVLDAQIIGSNSNCGYCFDILNITLVDNNIGSFQSLNNSIIQTNNTALNTLFQTYNVFEYGNGNQGQITRCNCNINDLKTSLQNLNSVIANVNIGSCGVVWLLKNENFVKQNSEIFPNPFNSTFEISNKETITNYNLYDVVGKEIVNSNSKAVLDSKTEALKTGVYLLELTFESSKKQITKLIKN